MSINRNIFKHTAIYSTATILGKMVGFILLPFYAHIFQAEGYGIIGMIDASIGLLEILFSRGFSNAIVRFYHEESDEYKGVVVTTSICLVWALSLLLIPFPLIFSKQLSSFILGSPIHANIIRLAIATLLFEVSANCASNYLLIKQKSILYSFVGLVRLVVGISLNILLVLVLRIGIVGVFIASLVTAVLTCVIFYWPIIRAFGVKFDSTIARKIIKFQLPLVPGDLISFFSRQTERFMVRFLISLQGVGILEMAYKFPPLLNLVITQPFLRAWRTKSMEIGEQDDAREIIGKMFTKYYFMMVFAGLVMAVNIDSILFIMTPEQFWGAASIAKIEIITTIIMGSITSLEFGLLYSKQTSTLSKIVSVTSIIKIFASYLLIKHFGLKGAAYSACFLSIVQAMLVTVKSQKFYRIELEYTKIVFISLSAISLALFVKDIHYADFPPAVFIKSSLFPHITEFLQTTSIGEWKSGKIVNMFKMKQDQLISLVFNTGLSLTYLAIIPIVWKQKFFARWQVVKNA